MEEEENIPFPYWNGFDGYRDSFSPTSLSDNFVAVFLEVEILLNYLVEWKLVLN